MILKYWQLMLKSFCVIVVGYFILFTSVWYAGTGLIAFFWQIRRECPTSIIDKFSKYTVNTNATYAGEATLYLL